MALRPLDGLGVGALAGQKQRAEGAQVVAADLLAPRVLLLDGAERRRRGEHRRHLVLGDHAPERAGIGRADRLALVQDGRAAVQQRRVADVRVAHHPADVGGSPERLARIDAVVVPHAPLERDHVPAVVAHHAFRRAGSARGVEDVERIGGLDGNAAGLAAARLRVGYRRGPVVVAAGNHVGLGHRPLQHQHGLRLVAGQLDGAVEQRLVGDDAAGLDAARRRQDGGRLGVLDARGKLRRGEAAEHHRVDGADAGAGQHGDHRFRHHRHVDDDPVALLDPQVLQHARPASPPRRAVRRRCRRASSW